MSVRSKNIMVSGLEYCSIFNKIQGLMTLMPSSEAVEDRRLKVDQSVVCKKGGIWEGVEDLIEMTGPITMLRNLNRSYITKGICRAPCS